MSAPWYFENDNKILPGQGFLASLLDTCLNHGLREGELLSHTRIFYRDLALPGAKFSTQQVLQLVKNVQASRVNTRGIEFEFGAQSLNHLPIPLAQLIANSSSLAEALTHLIAFQTHICPLIKIEEYNDGDAHYLVCVDRCGIGSQKGPTQQFLQNSALASIARLLVPFTQHDDDWDVFLLGEEPADVSHHYKFLGTQLHFDSPFHVLKIPQAAMKHAPVSRSRLAYEHHLSECMHRHSQLGMPPSFIDVAMRFVQREVEHNTHSLRCCADYFAMSESTLKRKFKKHHSSYQQVSDQGRTLLALKYLHIDGLSNERVAEKLRFTDGNNFRRSFKRWTGTLPSQYRKVDGLYSY
ncbi:putative HTH-type transcriptional regulator [BD1-7 clade bacterium]|uniref:Putative HTH-type transcriptional regulator n=1 Tax=BD1-7 clade bacterium TaxID=2029982 RepID=A0A5S9N5B4_9GAMM|nr:putative HTH-type transcriptional regulator [BD1-7 clade bacterium]CAA0085017.1 putative HTH-type transcriptional regulator [BD1-7 clade bacterium]